MRIGLYGLPSAGKTYILNEIRNSCTFRVLEGSSMLTEAAPDFHSLSENDRRVIRKTLASGLKKQDGFIMDGHYSFGKEVVFTEEDGELYDVILYLYTDPSLIRFRMETSYKNKKYAGSDIAKWQTAEIESLRRYCHEHNKDFYVLDNPDYGYFPDVHPILEFISCISGGYSCVSFARKCTEQILSNLRTHFRTESVSPAERITPPKEITLTDGDRTLIMEDTGSLAGYKTNVFDGNFYSGFQSWRHVREMAGYLRCIGHTGQMAGTGETAGTAGVVGAGETERIHFNPAVMKKVKYPCVILTSGHERIWKQISDKLGMPFYCGEQMSADTKYYIVKFLQEQGIRVNAFGDSLNDYYMIKQADAGYLVLRSDGAPSRSLKNKKLEGIEFV